MTAADIAEVAARWTGIPVAQLLAPERAKLLALPEALHERVVGQDVAVDAVADALQRHATHPPPFQEAVTRSRSRRRSRSRSRISRLARSFGPFIIRFNQRSVPAAHKESVGLIRTVRVWLWRVCAIVMRWHGSSCKPAWGLRVAGTSATPIPSERERDLTGKTRLLWVTISMDFTGGAVTRRARMGLSDPNRPIASFMFLGPTGVGAPLTHPPGRTLRVWFTTISLVSP